MYWQKRFTREDPDLAIKIEIEEIRKTNPNYGYRRLLPLLKLKGIVINKKKILFFFSNFKYDDMKYEIRKFSNRSLTISNNIILILVYCN